MFNAQSTGTDISRRYLPATSIIIIYELCLLVSNRTYNYLDALCVIVSAVSLLVTDALQGFKLSIPHPAFGIIL